MGAKLTNEQIQQLHTKLVVPVAIGDILTYGLNVEQDMQYGLHEALSEVDPDSALLAIALSAQQIAGASKASYPIASAVYSEATDILNNYGPNFIRDIKRGSLPENDFLDVLLSVPEDLEALADLLDALCGDIVEDTQDTENSAFVLATLLSIQARAHMEIASFILEEAGKNEDSYFAIRDQDTEGLEEGLMHHLGNMADASVAEQSKPVGDNIILFPAHLRN